MERDTLAAQFVELLETVSPVDLDHEIEQLERKLATLRDARKLIRKMTGERTSRKSRAPRTEAGPSEETAKLLDSIEAVLTASGPLRAKQIGGQLGHSPQKIGMACSHVPHRFEQNPATAEWRLVSQRVNQ